MTETPRTTSALVAGSTGLVGRECVDQLLCQPSFTRIIALVRRPLAKEITSDRLSVEIADFEHLDGRAELFRVENIFCALGTTMRRAGSEGAFRHVEYDYPLGIAKLGLAGGARHFLLVSALGADPGSRIFTNRVKGELEEAIALLGYPSFTIIRPSVILGERQEHRRGESLASRLGFLAPRRYRPVSAVAVASALVQAACFEAPGRLTIENREIG